ncbi:nucleolin 1-like [Miscanthus floridulus]|uniref:nucleolin 1-like n=1 Tax=Miscanthus floridulus TaxID=154761 RepID=UPI003459FE11
MKGAKAYILKEKFASFKMKEDESMSEIFYRLQVLVNDLKALGEKVEDNDFSYKDDDEEEEKKENKDEKKDENKKSVMFKATSCKRKAKQESSSEDEYLRFDEMDDEKMALFVKRFGKFMMKKGYHAKRKKSSSKNKEESRRATPRHVTSIEKMPTAPVRESLSARQTEDGPATTASGPSDGESLAHTIGASATMTEATTEKVDTLEAETTAVVDAPEAKDATPSMAEEQPSPPTAMLGVVGAAVRPQSPPVVPQAMAEEDEVVEIECATPKPQSIWILQKCGEEVVVVEEENTTREIKRLKSTVAGVMTQIEVSTAPETLIYVVGDQGLSLALFIHRG